MGYYIQAPTNKQKALHLIVNHGARLVGFDDEVPKWSDTEAIICVLDNGPFEAVGYAYSPRELEEFARADMYRPQRHRTWLMMDLAKARELSGFTG